jgi:hypothetical protein
VTLWTPVNITDGTLDLWFDANNYGSLALSGSNVNSWTDLANSVVMTTTGTTPTYSASLLNGLPGIVFPSSGGGGFKNTSTTHGNFSGPLSVFAVLTITTAGQGEPVFSMNTPGNGLAFQFAGSASPQAIQINQYGAGGSSSTQTLAVNTPAIAEWVAPGISGGSWGPVQPYITGTAGGVISALSTSGITTQSGVEIGTNVYTDQFTGDMHEQVILNTQASTNSRQLIEGYLAWKWGLQAGLPGGHPYQFAAPTVSVTNPFVNVWLPG